MTALPCMTCTKYSMRAARAYQHHADALAPLGHLTRRKALCCMHLHAPTTEVTASLPPKAARSRNPPLAPPHSLLLEIAERLGFDVVVADVAWVGVVRATAAATAKLRREAVAAKAAAVPPVRRGQAPGSVATTTACTMAPTVRPPAAAVMATVPRIVPTASAAECRDGVHPRARQWGGPWPRRWGW